VRTADCVPLLLADRAGRAVGAVHAGWRGVAAGIAIRAAESLRAIGVATGDLVAALGPGIGPCCYEVDDEVLDAVARAAGVAPTRISDAPARPGGGRRLDLHAALASQLAGAGVPLTAVHRAPWCTACADGLFHSYRRDGARSGRQMACIGWGPRADA
jgi:YfiH family protein